ncbi:hypothetical protein BKA70DRAFT_1439489 [Coprinopsis sp. MPI-PUGE-AT-0042]|nr:hypothetical protein BKA70DRAFT_1439489 [Coprinopsis sp. MPI-PUGE-AT-0042]
MAHTISWKDILACVNPDCGYGCQKFVPREDDNHENVYLVTCLCGCKGMQHRLPNPPPTATAAPVPKQAPEAPKPPEPSFVFKGAANIWKERTANNPASKVRGETSSASKAPKPSKRKKVDTSDQDDSSTSAPKSAKIPRSSSSTVPDPGQKQSAAEKKREDRDLRENPVVWRVVLIPQGKEANEKKKLRCPDQKRMNELKRKGWVKDIMVTKVSTAEDIDKVVKEAFKDLGPVQRDDLSLVKWRILQKESIGAGAPPDLKLVPKIHGGTITYSDLKDYQEKAHRQLSWKQIIYIAPYKSQDDIDIAALSSSSGSESDSPDEASRPQEKRPVETSSSSEAEVDEAKDTPASPNGTRVTSSVPELLRLTQHLSEPAKPQFWWLAFSSPRWSSAIEAATSAKGGLSLLTVKVGRNRLSGEDIQEFFDDLDKILFAHAQFLVELADLAQAEGFHERFRQDFRLGQHGLHGLLPFLRDAHNFITINFVEGEPSADLIMDTCLRSLETLANPLLTLVRHFRMTIDRALWDLPSLRELRLALKPGKDGQVYFPVAPPSQRLSILRLSFDMNGTDDYINAAMKDFGDLEDHQKMFKDSICSGMNGLDGLLEAVSTFLDEVNPLEFSQYYELFDMFSTLCQGLGRKAWSLRKSHGKGTKERAKDDGESMEVPGESESAKKPYSTRQSAKQDTKSPPKPFPFNESQKGDYRPDEAMDDPLFFDDSDGSLESMAEQHDMDMDDLENAAEEMREKMRAYPGFDSNFAKEDFGSKNAAPQQGDGDLDSDIEEIPNPNPRPKPKPRPSGSSRAQRVDFDPLLAAFLKKFEGKKFDEKFTHTSDFIRTILRDFPHPQKPAFNTDSIKNLKPRSKWFKLLLRYHTDHNQQEDPTWLNRCNQIVIVGNRLFLNA